jgi:hypothetical protein
MYFFTLYYTARTRESQAGRMDYLTISLVRSPLHAVSLTAEKGKKAYRLVFFRESGILIQHDQKQT